jgi:uncharacterized protein
LEGPWASFEDYLARLPSHRRISIRREEREVAEAGVRCRAEPLTANLAKHLVVLAGQNVARHDGVLDVDAYTQWVAALANNRQAPATAHLAERDGAIVGCVVCSSFSGRIYALFPGFDYEAIAGVPVYFALAYYHLVRHAVQMGLHAIEYGPAADQAKRLRGCVRYEQALWIRGVTPDARRVLADAEARR